MASSEVEEQTQSLKYKTSVLRVSIHCQGCKRKVHKLLQSVIGVHEIQIDARQQRVVVIGDVSPETLVRKLVKAGKHAELWPENPPEIRTQGTEKPPTTSQGSVSEESVVSGKEVKQSASKTENLVEDPTKVSKSAAPGGVGGKGDEGVGKSEGGKVAVEIKVEEKKPETGPAVGDQASQPVEEKKEEQTEKNGGGDGGGEGKKKKKKKPQNSNKNGTSSAPPPVNKISVNDGGGGGSPPAPTVSSNQYPPRHYGYQYPPPHYYTPPPPPAPVYTVSYNTAQPPVNSYTASYYAPPPPPQSYAYSHYGSEMAPPPPNVPSDYYSYRQQPPDSFEMFSDENPNGCLVM